MVADCWVFVGVGRFYLQSNTARIMPITLTKNRITYFSGLTNKLLVLSKKGIGRIMDGKIIF